MHTLHMHNGNSSNDRSSKNTVRNETKRTKDVNKLNTSDCCWLSSCAISDALPFLSASSFHYRCPMLRCVCVPLCTANGSSRWIWIGCIVCNAYLYWWQKYFDCNYLLCISTNGIAHLVCGKCRELFDAVRWQRQCNAKAIIAIVKMVFIVQGYSPLHRLLFKIWISIPSANIESPLFNGVCVCVFISHIHRYDACVCVCVCLTVNWVVKIF